MKVVLRNYGRSESVDCFVNESLESCLEYALMLHRSVFEPHLVRVVSDDDSSCELTLVAANPVNPKRS